MGLTPPRYLRLMALAVTEMFGSLTILLYIDIWGWKNVPRWPWTSWSDIHAYWNEIPQWPAVLLDAETLRQSYFAYSVMPFSAFLFWVFFGFGEEANSEYRKWRKVFKKAIFVISRGRLAKDVIENEGNSLPSYSM
jgi:hypothetical protein